MAETPTTTISTMPTTTIDNDNSKSPPSSPSSPSPLQQQQNKTHGNITFRKYQSETDQSSLLELICYLQDYERKLYHRMKSAKEYVNEMYIQDLVQECQEYHGEILVATTTMTTTNKEQETIGGNDISINNNTSNDTINDGNDDDDQKNDTTAMTLVMVVVGYAVVLTKISSTEKEAHETEYTFGEITDLAVHPDYQQQGIGKQLLQMCQECVQAVGTKYLRTQVLSNNIPAIQTYEKFGFQPHLITMEKEL